MYQVTFTVNNFVRYVVIVLASNEDDARKTILEYKTGAITIEEIRPYYSKIITLDDSLV